MIPHIPISAFLHGEHFPSQRESVVALYVDGSIRPGDIQVGAQLVPEAETPAFPSQQQVQRSISVCPLSRRSAGGRVRIRTERQTIARPQKDRQPPVSARYNGLPSGRRAAVDQADPLSSGR